MEINRIFYLLGYHSLLIIFMKQLIQILWSHSLDWDVTPSPEVRNHWQQFCDELPSLEKIQISRYITNYDSIDLIGFADASQMRYGAVVYCRFPSGNSVELFFSKDRVAPMKRITLPRHELCGGLLLSRLLKFIILTLLVKSGQITAFSDFKVILAWILSPAYKWNRFVSNHVTGIQNNVALDRWHYVTTSDKAADVASCGLSLAELVSCQI